MVIGGGFQRKVFDQLFERAVAEEVGGNETLLDQEPAEDDAGEQPDEKEGFLLFRVAVLRQADGAAVHEVMRPEIPVGDFAVEVVGERVGAEATLPGFVKLIEAGDSEVGSEVCEGEIIEDLKMGADRIVEPDILDEGGLFQNVALGIAFVQTAVDDGERHGIAMPQEHERGHGQRLVDGAGDGGKVGAGVVAIRKLYSKKQVGVALGLLDSGGIIEKVAVGGEFGVGELEEQVEGGESLKGFALALGELLALIELIEERFGRGDGDVAVGNVAEGGEQPRCGLRKREGVEFL